MTAPAHAETAAFVDFMFTTRTRRQSDGTIALVPAVRPGEHDDGEVIAITDPNAYVAAVLEREVRDLAETPDGGRNGALSRAAFVVGRLLGGKLPVEHDEAMQQLYDACDVNGYNAEHDDALRTIRRGFRDGEAKAPLLWEHTPATPHFPAPLPWVPAPIIGPDGEELAPKRTSWAPVDLGPVISGHEEEPPPAYLTRLDGKALLYRAKVNALIGESESGKTWVALLVVSAALNAGEPVLYLDFEDTAAGIIARLRLLGVTDDQLRRLVYISPDEELTAEAQLDLERAIAVHVPQVIVVDGVNAAMTLLGLDLTSNTDATQFSLSVLRPLKRTGAAVITIDHVTKSKDGRGNYAIGAQAKRADIDGCALLVEVVEPFGRGMTGKLRLTVSKDRPGHVRAISKGAKVAGFAILVSDTEGGISGNVEVPGEASDGLSTIDRRKLLAMRLLTEWEIAGGGQTPTKTNLANAVGGNTQLVLEAIGQLVADDYIGTLAGSRHNLRVLRPFEPVSHRPQPFDTLVLPSEVPEASGKYETAPVLPSPPPPIGGGKAVSPAGVNKHTGEVIAPNPNQES